MPSVTTRTIQDLVRGPRGIIPVPSFTRSAILDERGRIDLIQRKNLFELVAIGWKPGQVHVDSRSFHSCEIYQPEKGCYHDVPLGSTSRLGTLCPDERAEAV